MARFGGEYRDPERDLSRHQARAYLLERLGSAAPKIVTALREDVLPRYRETWEATTLEPTTTRPPAETGSENSAAAPVYGPRVTGEGRASRDVSPEPEWAHWQHSRGEWSDGVIADGPDPLRAFHAALMEWAGQYRMAHDWILDGALRTLKLWRGREALESEYGEKWWLGDNGTDWPVGLLPPHVAHAEAAEPFQFEYAGWPPTVETKASFEARLDIAYYNAKSRYFARLEAKPKALRHVTERRDPDSPAWDRSPEMRRKTLADGSREFVQFDWFIRFQFLGETHAEIAHVPGTAKAVLTKTVAAGCKKVAELVGIERRPAYDD